MSELEVQLVPCLKDNYAILLHDEASGLTAVVDTPDAAAISEALERQEWMLTHILNTHHHHDHTGGNLELKARTGCTVVGPKADADRIPGIDQLVGEGDEFAWAAHRVVAHDTPGHTRGHIVYHLPDDQMAFVGDTLFALGCGRLFEGTPQQMWDSLGKILAWPDETKIYCAHEYTEANARFALNVEPGNAALVARANEVRRLRTRGIPTVPTTLALEKATNPFLRASSPNLRATIGLVDADDVEVFARTRALKDTF